MNRRCISEPFRTLIWVIPVAGGMTLIALWALNNALGRIVVSFRDTNLDDSPKSRVLEFMPDAKCEAVYWNGKRAGYVVSARGKTLGYAEQAYQAWQNAEGKLMAGGE